MPWGPCAYLYVLGVAETLPRLYVHNKSKGESALSLTKHASEQNLLASLQEWYRKQCDDRWEHQYGVMLESTDNPGWILTIDLTGTSLDGKQYPHESAGMLPENLTADDWMDCRVENNRFVSAGSDLVLVLRRFVDWCNKDSGD